MSSTSSSPVGPIVRASGPPKGIYFNFLGFCVGAFRMRKKGNDLQIIGPDDHKEGPKRIKTKKYRRKKKIREKMKEIGYGTIDEEMKEDRPTNLYVDNDNCNTDRSGSINESCNDSANDKVRTDDFLSNEKTKEFSSSSKRDSHDMDVSIDIPGEMEGSAPVTEQPFPDSVINTDGMERGNIEYASGAYLSDNFPRSPVQSTIPPPIYNVDKLESVDLNSEIDRHEWETDSEGEDPDVEVQKKSPQSEAQSAQNMSAALSITLFSILVLAPLIAFLVYGIIFLVEDKDVCPGSPLWVYGVIFMCIFFPTPFVTQSYKWGLVVWSILFTLLAIILYYPNVVCRELTHTGLYIWSLCAFWFLFAHILLSVIVFIVQLVNAPKQGAIDNVLNEGSPLVQGRNRVQNIPSVVVPEVSPGDIRGGALGV